jgi:hypothetical protein
MGLDVELSELERSERVAWSGFAKDHCCRCVATLRSAMVLLEEGKGNRRQWFQGSRARLGGGRYYKNWGGSWYRMKPQASNGCESRRG